MYEWIFLNTRKCVCGLSKIERRKKIFDTYDDGDGGGGQRICQSIKIMSF